LVALYFTVCALTVYVQYLRKVLLIYSNYGLGLRVGPGLV